MAIERFFGKGRSAQTQTHQAKTGAQDETKTRRNPSTTTGAETAAPRNEPTGAAGTSGQSGQTAVLEPITKASIVVAPAPEPSSEEIAVRAYDLWVSQGWPEGRDWDNWIEAERQLRAERSTA